MLIKKPPKAKKIRRLRSKQQIRLLRNILPLAKANMTQKEIATRLRDYGLKHEVQIGLAALNSLRSGQSFANGIKPWLDPLAWEALLAGEKIGHWAKGIEDALTTLKISDSMGSQLVMALGKPIAIISLMLAGYIAAHLFFFPKIADLYPIEKWPELSRIINQIGEELLSWGPSLLMIMIPLLIAVLISLSRFTGPIRASLDKYPIYRQYRLIQGSTLLRSMGNLSLAGFDLKNAVISSKKTANHYLGTHLDTVRLHLGQGKRNIGDILDTGLFDAAEQSAIKVLGEKGAYGDTLLNSAEIMQEKLLTEIDIIRVWGGNTLTLVGGFLSFGLIGGIAMLMFDLATNIR